MSLIAWLRRLFHHPEVPPVATTSGRIPAQIDLNLYAGDSEIFGLTLTDENGPVDTTVGQWAAQIKPEGATDPVEAFTVTLDLETIGRLELAIDAGASQRLGVYTQKLRWDLQQSLPDAVTVITHAQGHLVVTDDVTRVPL